MDVVKVRTGNKFFRWRRPLIVGGFVFTALMWGYIIYLGSIPASDWRSNYLPTVQDLLRGNSPYIGHSAFNPFWTYILLVPFSLLPPVLGHVAIGITCMVVFGFVGYRLGAKPLPLAMLIFTPQLIFLSRNGGIDWMVVLGFILPPQIGLFFVLIKPQIGICVAVFWLIEAWRKGKLREVFRVFTPICVGYTVGYAIFGIDAIWRGSQFIGTEYPWDATTFPFTIPIGLVLLVFAIRSRDLKFAIPASPFIAPYVAFYSWPASLLSIVSEPWLMAAAWFGMWITTIFTLQF